MKGAQQAYIVTKDTTVRKWGNGLGLHIPKTIAKRLDLTVGDNIEFNVDEQDNIKLSIQSKEDKLVIEDLTMDDLFTPHDQPIAPEDPWGISTGLEIL